jgi:nucleotide-binding universal stress UspA family protein
VSRGVRHGRIVVAELTGAAVQAVGAWEAHGGQGGNARVYPDEVPAERAAVRLSEAIGEAATGRASVEVSHTIAEGHPADVLVEAARTAEILVMGNRGHGRFTGALAGSITQRCIQHASCPVVVIRAEESDDE